MSSISQGLVLATAMAVSAGTIILLDLCREKYFPSAQMAQHQDSPQEKQNIKSCLSSGIFVHLSWSTLLNLCYFFLGKLVILIYGFCVKTGGKKGDKNKKKKRVKFAADVKEPSGNGKEYRREHSKNSKMSTKIQTVSCGMPANRMALYSGILKDRLLRTEFSY